MSTSKLLFNPLLNDQLQRLSTTAETVISATKEPTGFDDPANITVTYTLADRTITLSHSSGFVKFWARGVEHSYASPWIVPTVLGGAIPITHTNANGSYYLKIHADTLVVSYDTTPWEFQNYITIAFTYKDATAQFSLRECHGLMPWQSHEEEHYATGTYLRSAVVPTAGTYAVVAGGAASDANNTPGLDAHTIYDEDLATVIPAWPQGTYTVAYRLGVGGAWTWSITDTSMFKIGASTFIQYNLNTGGTWSLADVAEDGFVNILNLSLPVTADTDSQKYRVIRIVGQRTFTTLAAAQAELPAQYDFGNLIGVLPEFVSNALWTFQKASAGGNSTPAGVAGRCFIAAEPIKFVGSQRTLIGQSGFSPTDHQSLSNRAATGATETDCAHPSYAVSTQGVAWTAGGVLSATELTVQAALDKLSSTFAGVGTVGLVSAGVQTFSGAKTFAALATFSLGLAVTGGVSAAGSITRSGTTWTIGNGPTITEAGAATFATSVSTPTIQNGSGTGGVLVVGNKAVNSASQVFVYGLNSTPATFDGILTLRCDDYASGDISMKIGADNISATKVWWTATNDYAGNAIGHNWLAGSAGAKVGGYDAAGAWTFPVNTTHTFGNVTTTGPTIISALVKDDSYVLSSWGTSAGRIGFVGTSGVDNQLISGMLANQLAIYSDAGMYFHAGGTVGALHGSCVAGVWTFPVVTAGVVKSASGVTASLSSGGIEDFLSVLNLTTWLITAHGNIATNEYVHAIARCNSGGTVMITSLGASGLSIIAGGSQLARVVNSATTQTITFSAIRIL